MDLNKNSLVSPSSVVSMSEEIDLSDFHIIEEGPNISQNMDLRNLQIIEEGPRICPLCLQEIKSYYINYNEKIQMCENIECVYPFGCAPILSMKEGNGGQESELNSLGSRRTTRSTISTLSRGSESGLSECEKICHALGTDDVTNDALDKLDTVEKPKKTDAELRREELKRNVEKIKEMTKSFTEMRRSRQGIIKNEKWIKNLSYLSGLSGVNLLRPEERKNMKMKVVDPGMGELKIDIDTSNMNSIKIDLIPK